MTLFTLCYVNQIKTEHHQEAEEALWDEKVTEGKFQGQIESEHSLARGSHSRISPNIRKASLQDRGAHVLRMISWYPSRNRNRPKASPGPAPGPQCFPSCHMCFWSASSRRASPSVDPACGPWDCSPGQTKEKEARVDQAPLLDSYFFILFL